MNRVRIADRTWFERHPSRWGLLGEVWRLGRSIRSEQYDLGIDVRGDVLSVLVLALGGIPRRVGWAMGGGAFLLTDIADWVRGRHEVRARLALLDPLGIPQDDPPRVEVHVTDSDRAIVADAWPRLGLERPLGGSKFRSAPAGDAVPKIAASYNWSPPRQDSALPILTGCTRVDSGHFPLFWPCTSVPALRPSDGPTNTGTRSFSNFFMTAGEWLSWAARKIHPRPRYLHVMSACVTGPGG